METGAARIAAAFASARGRAALMPYLMGGFPDVESSARIGIAYADAGADLVELGVPFSDPLADGPVIHAAATRAAISTGHRTARHAAAAPGQPILCRLKPPPSQCIVCPANAGVLQCARSNNRHCG